MTVEVRETTKHRGSIRASHPAVTGLNPTALKIVTGKNLEHLLLQNVRFYYLHNLITLKRGGISKQLVYNIDPSPVAREAFSLFSVKLVKIRSKNSKNFPFHKRSFQEFEANR